MQRTLRWCGAAFLLNFGILVGTAQAATVNELVAAMKQARQSNGFEVRMNVYVIAPDGKRAMPMKISVIGQSDATRQRLLVRGIAPEAIRDRYVVVERNATDSVKAFGYTAQSTSHPRSVDAVARLFESGVRVWDLLMPWWDWSQQTVVAEKAPTGHECVWVHSRQGRQSEAGVESVESCVDSKNSMTWHTRLRGAKGQVLREISVISAMRKSVGSGLAAKKLTIAEANKTVTEIEVYAGDEAYQITPETFAILERDATRN